MKYLLMIFTLLTGLLFFTACGKNDSPQVRHCTGVWSECKGECGEGKGKQYFVVLQQAENGGMACEALDGQEKACTASVCQFDGVFCKEGDFSPVCPFNPNLDVDRPCKIGEPIQCSSGVRYNCKASCPAQSPEKSMLINERLALDNLLRKGVEL